MRDPFGARLVLAGGTRARHQEGPGARARTITTLCVLVAGVCLLSMMPVAASAETLHQPEAVCSPTIPTSPPVETTNGGFHAIDPTRVLDTRLTIGAVGAGCTAVVDLVGVVPQQASSAALDVVAVGAVGVGYVTVYPCDQPRPVASNLNSRTGDAVPNAVVVPLQAGRRICLYTSITTQLVVDVTGWFGPGGIGFDHATPSRALDTRFGPRPDGGAGPLTGGAAMRIPLAGLNGVPADAQAVSVNITATNTSSPGWVTAYPCGTPLPATSNGNYQAGATRASQALVGLGGGALCIYTSATIDLIVDVSGWFSLTTDGTRMTPIVGTRVVDSRSGIGGWSGPIQAGQTKSFDPSVAGTVPVGATAALDIVATNASGDGYVTLYPCGGPLPATSSLNFLAGEDVANLATIPVGANGLICVYASNTTQLVVDVTGSLGASGPLRALNVTGGLNPAFTPDGHDYGVPCAEGTNNLTVTATPVPQGTATVSGANGAGVVSAVEDQLITITATTLGGQSEQYFVRCLPHDFPALEVHRLDDPTPGWYMMTTGVAAPIGSPAYAVILDDHGAAVWYHKADTKILDFKRLPNGNLAWAPLLGPGFGVNPFGAFEERTLDSAVVRTWSTVGTPTDFHEMLPMANGNMMMESYHFRAGVDVSALGPAYPSPANVMDSWIQEIRPDGTVAWSWHSEDHIAPAETVSQLEGVGIDNSSPNGPILDLIHNNSIEVDPATGNLIVSARHLDAVFAIRRNPGQPDDGNVLWKLGGNAPTSPTTKDLTPIGDIYGGPHAQHDARLLPNGHLSMFDDESGHPDRTARGIEYALDLNAGTATVVWQYFNPTGNHSNAMGSTRRYADGSTVIGWGLLNELFDDIGPWDNRTLYLVQKPLGIGYRVIKEPLSSFDAATLRANAG